MTHRPSRRILSAALCAAMAVLAATSANAGEGDLHLPNLAGVAPYDVRIERPDPGSNLDVEWALRFTTAVANRGEYAIDLLGMPQDPVAQVSSAHQCVRWIEKRVCTERREVGRFVWHPAHFHYHVEDFATYELRKLTAQGVPDMSEAGLVATSGKVSFCLQDSRWDGNDPPPALERNANPMYYQCYPFQGIDPGWQDEYDWHLFGQQLLLDGILDGDYALMLTVNPARRLLETRSDDNVGTTIIRLSAGGTEVSVLA